MVVAIPSRGVAYWPVPKAGCSSVKAMLSQIDPDNDAKMQDVDADLLHKVYPTRRFRQARFREQENAFRFTVLRDPIKRLMSVYTNRVMQKRDLENRKLTMQSHNLPVYPGPDAFFQNLDAYCRASTRIYHHVRHSAFYCGKQLDKFNRVYRTDEIEQLARDLSDITGETVTASRRNVSTVSLEFTDLRVKTREQLTPFLRQEYEHLAGYFDNPFD